MELGEKYDFTVFDLEELRQKRHRVTWRAFSISFNRRRQDIAEGRPPFFVDIILDCDGAPVPTSVSKEGSAMFAQSCPGAEWSYPNYTNYFHHGTSKTPGFITDQRSWLDILKGCCPMFP